MKALEELRSDCEKARAEAKETGTKEARDKAKAAWAALAAASPKLSKACFASQAGKRQYAERKAQEQYR